MPSRNLFLSTNSDAVVVLTRNELGRMTLDKREPQFPIARSILCAYTGRRCTCRCCISRGQRLQCVPLPEAGGIHRAHSTRGLPPPRARRLRPADEGPCRDRQRNRMCRAERVRARHTKHMLAGARAAD